LSQKAKAATAQNLARIRGTKARKAGTAWKPEAVKSPASARRTARHHAKNAQRSAGADQDPAQRNPDFTLYGAF